KVRKALSLAIDRQAIVDTILKGGQQPATAYIPPQIPGGSSSKDFRSEGKDYISLKADPEQAKKLLAEAGYPDGKDFPKITYIYNESSTHKAVAEALQAMWKKNLGIDVDLQVQEWKVFISNRTNGNYEIARHGYIADFNDAGSLFDLWVSGSPNNDAKYNNPEYDRIVNAATREQDPARRSELYHQAEDILMNDMPIAPLFYYNIQYMLQPYIKGMHISPLGWSFFRTVEIQK
ncbi:MAG: peptide ABC transporter substrate-binding protein, partial [Firmicutes bacterium]|nr:peptide ABC transporter substrate-binding protein [Bacillota bacterium]